MTVAGILRIRAGAERSRAAEAPSPRPGGVIFSNRINAMNRQDFLRSAAWREM